MKVIKCRGISKGVAEGVSLVSTEAISFFGHVDPSTGIVIKKDHPLYGQQIAERVLIFPRGKGSTVGSYVLYQLSKNGKAPVAIIMKEADTVVATGAIISNIPLVDRPEYFEFKSEARIKVDADKGEIWLD